MTTAFLEMLWFDPQVGPDVHEPKKFDALGLDVVIGADGVSYHVVDVI